MRILDRLSGSGLLPKHKWLEIYPPFLFMGVRFESFAPDYRRVRFSLPLRWYSKNQHGTLFGGFVCAVADPIPALMCGQLFPGIEVWTQSNCVEFRKPGRGRVYATIEVTAEDERAIREELGRRGKCSHEFRFAFTDAKGGTVAEARNTVYLRDRARRSVRRSGG